MDKTINKPTEMVDWLLMRNTSWVDVNTDDDYDWDSAYVVKYYDPKTGKVERFPICGIIDIIPFFDEYFVKIAERLATAAREYNLPNELIYKDEINDIEVVVEKDSPLYWYTARKEISDEKFQEFCKNNEIKFDACSLCSSEWMNKVELWKICREVY